MKSWMMIAAVGAVLAIAGCDQPYQQQTETAPPPMEAPAPAATDQTGPVADTAAAPLEQTPPLPADERSSEQSVQPESETLFY